MPPSLPSDSGGEEPPADDFVTPDDEFRPPLPPEDRIWRHPSEVAAASRARQATQTERPPSRRAGRVSVATVAVAALIGATMSIGLVAVLGGFEERVVERRVPVELPSVDGGGTRAAVTTLTSPSVVGLSIRHGDEWTQSNAMVLTSDGHLLTTAGSLENSDAIEVHLADGQRVSAEVVGRDPLTDVGVVAIDGDEWTPVVIGTADNLDVGEEMMAIGMAASSDWSPLLTTTVVRALRQRALGQDTSLHDAVVIEAELTAELAGAPVVDRRGAVVGMVASAGTTAATAGTVVIPIDDAVQVADEIIEYGRARHVWLGVGGHDVDRDHARANGLRGGATISSVFPDSPADASGVQPGDIVTALNHTPIASMTDLVLGLRDYEPGDTVTLTVVRDGESTTIPAELDERKGP